MATEGTELFISVLGPFSVRTEEKDLQISGRKAKSLLAILALESPKPVQRDELCKLLWPDVEAANARNSLRQNLTMLRRAFATESLSILWTRGDQIGLDGAKLRCDLLDLAEAATTEASIQLGDALPRLFVDLGYVGAEFEQWINVQRAYFIQVAQKQLRRSYENSSEPSDIRILSAKTALKIDELDENAIRALMQCYVSSGNSAVALRTYNQFYEMLEDQLDAEPSAETQDLAVAIKLSLNPNENTGPVERSNFTSAQALTNDVVVAVLPFEVFGLPERSDFLPIGIMDQITCYLASLQAPSVISSNTTRRYLGQTPRPADVGRDLKAKFAVTGYMNIEGSEAAVSTQLVDCASEHVLWAENIRCETSQLTGLSIPIAQKIAQALVPTIEIEELRQTRAITSQELAPYHLVLRAKENIFRLDKEGFWEAGALLRQAVELDPHFAPSHALCAHWYTIALWEGWSEDPISHRAELEQHLRQAQRLAPADGRIVALAAHNKMMLDRGYAAALTQLSEALRLFPSDSETLAWSVPTLTCTRNADEAVSNGKKALELSPYDPFLARNEHFLSFAFFTKGDYDSSAEYGLSCFERHPDFYSGNLRVTIAALCAAGRKQETVKLVERHNRIEPDFTISEFKQKQRLQHASDRDSFAELLVEAGLPN